MRASDGDFRIKKIRILNSILFASDDFEYKKTHSSKSDKVCCFEISLNTLVVEPGHTTITPYIQASKLAIT